MPNVFTALSLAATLLGGTPSTRAGNPGACDLVTRDEVSTAIGVAVTASLMKSRTGGDALTCRYTTATPGTAVSVTITPGRGGHVAEECREAEATPVAGVGGAACEIAMAAGAGTMVLTAKGDVALSVLVARPRAGTAADDALRLARRALARL